MADWLGRLSAFLPGAAGMADEDKRALITQGLLAMGAGILKNNSGNYGKAGPAIGAGISEGLLAMNKGADNLSEQKYRQQVMERQLGDPAGVREFNMMTQGLSDDERERARRIALGLEGRASNAGFGFSMEADANGVPRPQRMNPRTGDIEVFVSESQQWIPLGMQRDASGQAVQFDSPLPPEVQQSILQNPQAWENGHVEIPTFTPAPVPGIGRGRRKEDEAGAVAAAQKSVELQALPTELQLRTQAAIEQAGGSAQAQAGVEQQTANRQKQTALAQYEAAREGVVSGLAGTQTGPIVGRLPALTKEQQIAEGGVAALAPILKQVFRAAGEGVFTDRDQQLLLDMAPKRTDHPEAAAAKIRNIDAIVKAKLGAAGAPAVRRYNPATGKIE